MSHLTSLRRSGEAMLYAAIALLGLVAAVVGSGYGMFGEGGRIGPGFLPVVAGALTAALCASVAVGVVRRAAHGEPEPSIEPVPDIDSTGRSEKQRVLNLWVVFGLTLVALLLVQVVGFLAAFGLLVLVISAVVEKQNVVKSLVITTAALAVVYLLFGLFLGVPLPGGMLGLGTEA
ncbi:tripartite tricarboxylate transporter TctB family protein [Knoellia remsis]|uniref:Tripartite tricarboxylate transporter TctB family protein n=1 Tax=Knoellia remsis TaxID=407159 RepID=A0A2T0UHZ7_9MICO|nr:tripartite tricarboxylate transporter TctB family protein [Knoellia remsis]PRY57555.1 tripartite tricarboxylate transporter TctB family protein [Knoellia remsis]